MKTIVSLAFICLALCLSSCDFLGLGSSSDSMPQTQFQEQKISNLQKEIESLRSEIASLNAVSEKGAASHIDSLNNSISYIEERLDVLEDTDKKVDERISNVEKSKSERFFWMLSCLCLISWIISIWALIKAQKVSNIDRRLNRHREEIEGLKHDCYDGNYLNQNVQSLSNSVRRIDQELYNMKSKLNSVLSQITSRLDGLRGGGNNYGGQKNPSDNGNVEKKPEANQRSGYFGDIIGGTYFRDLMVSKERAVFSVTVKEDVAEFKPIFEQLRGNDNARDGFEPTGTLLKDATAMTVEVPGIAEKCGDKWIIKSKAKIRLS